jgi:hypothetical protein
MSANPPTFAPAREALSTLQAHGITLLLDGDALKYLSEQGAYTPELRQLVAANRPGIVAALREAAGLNPLNHYGGIPCDEEAGLVGLFGVVACGELLLARQAWEREPSAHAAALYLLTYRSLAGEAEATIERAA